MNGIWNDNELAARYLPSFYADRREPFPVRAVGYTVCRASCASPSFNRFLELKGSAVMVIEYAVYFDFDIQHLYDLEHVWIYLDRDGRVCDAEGSAHGGYFNCLKLADGFDDETHLRLCLQPGKHAVFPRGELFLLYPNYREVCGALAGKDGVLVPQMLEGRVSKPEGIDEAVHRYVQRRYTFEPTLEFVKADLEADRALMPWNMLLEAIPGWMEAVMEEIGRAGTAENGR